MTASSLVYGCFAATIWLTGCASFPPQKQGELAARRPWAHTGLRVEKGRRYRVEVDFPKDACHPQFVKDWTIPVRDLTGWPEPAASSVTAKALSPLLRLRSAPWFALVATVDRRYPQRLAPDLGPAAASYRPPATGELVCYFNDVCFAYWNNHGVVRLHLTPLP